jgi:hypothetical protein
MEDELDMIKDEEDNVGSNDDAVVDEEFGAAEEDDADELRAASGFSKNATGMSPSSGTVSALIGMEMGERERKSEEDREEGPDGSCCGDECDWELAGDELDDTELKEGDWKAEDEA